MWVRVKIGPTNSGCPFGFSLNQAKWGTLKQPTIDGIMHSAFEILLASLHFDVFSSKTGSQLGLLSSRASVGMPPRCQEV